MEPGAANRENAGREYRPILPESPPSVGISCRNTCLSPSHRPIGRDRLCSESPYDLHIAWFVKIEKVVRRQSFEGDVGLPRFGHRTNHDLTTGLLGENTPAERQSLIDDAPRLVRRRLISA